MATLVKERHGLLYEDYFQENSLIWSLTPSNVDCLRFEPDGLRILHNSHYITYTMKEPEDPYCLLVKLDHVPMDKEDIGGVIVFSNTEDYAECQTYLADHPSTIGNDGENLSINYGLDSQYVKYSIDETGESEEDSDSPLDTPTEDTVVNPENGFVDTVYKFIKMIKHNNSVGYTYQFLASHDGFEWIEVGTADYKARTQIGFFLYAAEKQRTLLNGKFVINSFYLYKQPNITINGINILQEFEIFDSHLNRTILRSDTTPGIDLVNCINNRVEINTNGIILPLTDAKLRIFPKRQYDVTIAEYTLDNLTFGGDVFTINYDIKLFIDNTEVTSGELYDLGELFTQSFKKNVVVYNNEDFDLASLKISIVAYSEYYSGEEVVKIAFYEGLPMDMHPLEYEYSDQLLIPRLEAHEGKELVMKLSDVPKQEFYSVANQYRFKLIIE